MALEDKMTRKIILGPIRIVTVPGGSHWVCTQCGKGIRPGEKVAKRGMVIFCPTCIKEGMAILPPLPGGKQFGLKLPRRKGS